MQRKQQSTHRYFQSQRLSRRSAAKAGAAAGLGLAGLAAHTFSRQASAQETVTISYTYWGSNLERDQVEAAIAGFEEEYPSIQVESQHIPDDYEVKINTLAAANDLPDIFKVGAGLGLSWGSQGVVLNMEPYLDDLGPRLPLSYYDYAPDGSIGLSSTAETYFVFCNEDLFTENEVELPPVTGETAWNWDEFLEAAKALTLDRQGRNAADPEFDGDNIQQFGFSFYQTFDGWYPYILSNGGDIVSEDGMTWRINEPEAVDALQRMQDLIHVHRVSPTPAQSEGLAAINQQLATRRVAMAAGGQWELLDVAQADVPLALGVLPKLVEPKTLFTSSATVINAATPHREAALSLYTFLVDPANALGMYTSGLWMPNDLDYYTDPELVASWIDNDVHPPEYETAAMDYLRSYGEPMPVRLRNWDSIQPRLEQLVGPIWAGEGSVQSVLDGIVEELGPMLEGRYSS